MGMDANEYRDHQLALRKKQSNSESPSSLTEDGTPIASAGRSLYDNPPIDLVCRRIVLKWEPIFNIVHRYAYCRCVIRLSTPSHIEMEQTFLMLGFCPRHNCAGLCHKDYGDLDYQQDQYFEEFGGYRSFQGLLYVLEPKIYGLLGGERFLPSEHVEEAQNALAKFRKENAEGFIKVLFEYQFDINDKLERIGYAMPQSMAEAVRYERLQRSGRFTSNDEQRRDVYDSPMMKEVRLILNGEWSGEPHWTLED